MRDFEAICRTTVPFDLCLIEPSHPDLACDLDVTFYPHILTGIINYQYFSRKLLSY